MVIAIKVALYSIIRDTISDQNLLWCIKCYKPHSIAGLEVFDSKSTNWNKRSFYKVNDGIGAKQVN